MRTAEEPFVLEVEGDLIMVAEFEIGEKRIFHLDFKGASKPLVITVALLTKTKSFGHLYLKVVKRKLRNLAS